MEEMKEDVGKEDGHGAPAVKGAQYCHLWMPELIEIPVSASSRSDQAGPSSLRPKDCQRTPVRYAFIEHIYYSLSVSKKYYND